MPLHHASLPSTSSNNINISTFYLQEQLWHANPTKSFTGRHPTEVSGYQYTIYVLHVACIRTVRPEHRILRSRTCCSARIHHHHPSQWCPTQMLLMAGSSYHRNQPWCRPSWIAETRTAAEPTFYVFLPSCAQQPIEGDEIQDEQQTQDSWLEDGETIPSGSTI